MTATGFAGLLVLAGCASHTGATARTTTPPLPVNTATSLNTAQGTWAIADMGGSAPDENFWQLFIRPAGASSWRLVTPEGVADQGGLIAAGSPTSLLAGFGISQGLAFSPLATSTDTGNNWAPGLIGPGDALEVDPDSLSIGPATRELALLDNGTVDQGTGGGTWTRLTSAKALKASAPGLSCGLAGINAVSFGVGSTGRGAPLVAGSCTRPGVVGIFSDAGGAWQAAGPTLPAGYGGDPVQVVRLVSTPTGNAALLRAGTSLFVAWTTRSAGPRVTGPAWTTPVALPRSAGSRAAEPISSGFGPNGSAWVLLAGGHAEVIGGAGGTWQALPMLPTGTAVLAAPMGTTGDTGGNQGYEALAVANTVLTVWRLDAGTWTKAQVINVPIAFGSSG